MFRQFYLHLKFSTKISHWSPPMGTFGTIGWTMGHEQSMIVTGNQNLMMARFLISILRNQWNANYHAFNVYKIRKILIPFCDPFLMFHWKERLIGSWFNLHEFLVNNCIQNIYKQYIDSVWKLVYIASVNMSNIISKFQTSSVKTLQSLKLLS